MIAAAVILLAAAIGAIVFQRTGWHTAAVTVILGGATTSISGLILLASQLLLGDFTPWFWAWVAMTAGGIWATIQVLRTGERIPYPKQFAIAVTFTALLAVANFAYSSLYQPSVQSNLWSVEVDFGKPAYHPKRTYGSIPITLTFDNKGKVPLYVLMATYSVVGRRGSVVVRDQTREQLNLAVQNNKPASRRTVVKDYDLLQTGQFVGPGSWFEAGDRTVIGSTVDLPLPTPYDAIALNATVLVMRKDRATLKGEVEEAVSYSWDTENGEHESDAPGWVADPGIDTVRYQAAIGEGSYLREQTRDDWVETVWWVLADPAPNYPAGQFIAWRFAPRGSDLDANPKEVDRDNQRAFDRYGITWWDTGLYEVSVHHLGLSKPPAPKS
jgi:hypothetical protein